MAQAPALGGVSTSTGRHYATFEEFLASDEPEHSEWVGGTAVAMPGVTQEHGLTTGFLIAALTSFVGTRRLGRVFHDPFLMRVRPDGPGRAPDLMFIAEEHLHRLHENYLEGPPDVAVEVMSPGSRAIDRGEKFYEYEAAGIPEYWLLDPDRRVAEFHRLDSAGHYQAVLPEEGVFRSEVLSGFWLRVEWLWERPPLPDVEAELGLR
jgi:Uma2 family endonuclease